MDLFVDINMVRWLLSVLVLVLLLGGFALVAPHFARYRNTKSRKGKKKKLKLIETLHIDAKHKVVLFQAGAVEHTILTGPNDDLHLSVEALDEEDVEEDTDLPIGFLKEIPSVDDPQNKKTTKKKKGKKSE